MGRNVKIISFCIENYLYDMYLRDFKGNRSSFIREHFIKGIDEVGNETETLKRKYIEKNLELIKVVSENAELKNKIERLRKGKLEMNEEEMKLFIAKKMMKANIKRGIIRNNI